jgi:hypothetical protein
MAKLTTLRCSPATPLWFRKEDVMRPSRLLIHLLIAAAMAWMAAPSSAQDTQSGEQPKPAAKTYGPIGAENQDQDQNQQDLLQPDNRPLTGIQQLTIGTPSEQHSYWVPGVSYYNFIQSNGQTQGVGSTGWNSTSYVAGNLSLRQNFSRSELFLNYSGGGDFTSDSAIKNGWFQQLGISNVYSWERWQLTLLDDFSYLPQPQFGFGNGTGLAMPGIGGTLGAGSTGLESGLNPGGSVFNAIGPRYSNAAGAQINYSISRRSSITLGGVYGLLRFTDSGNIENNTYTANAGYNYQLTRLDTIGVVYQFSSFHFVGMGQAIGSNSIQAAYGRKITGRLALQLTAGPQITEYRLSLPGSTKTRYTGVAASASLTYALQRSTFQFSYQHGVTSGSGVFTGATTDQLTVSATRRLSRVWSGDAHFGFSHNQNSQTISGVPTSSYNTLYGGAALARPLGRNATVSAGYTVYRETSNNVGGYGFTSHQISLGLSWHTRPLVLR